MCRILDEIRVDEQKHLKPFMRAMHQTEAGQGTQSPGKIELGGMPDLQQNGQSHTEKGQAIEKINRDEVLQEEIGQGFHETGSRSWKRTTFLALLPGSS
jgi:hypothetical protein